MLNRTYHNTHVSVDFPDAIEIVHKHAPTSEQIKLLREMEKDLKDNMLGHVRLDNNGFNFNCFINQINFNQLELVAKIKLNGKECTVTHKFDKFSSQDKAVKEFFQKISDAILFEFLTSGQKEVERVLESLNLA